MAWPGKRRRTEPSERPPQPVEIPAGGSLDEPLDGATVERDVLTVSGWASFPSTPTARVEIELGGHPLGLAQLGVPRPDVAAELERPAAAISGFTLTHHLRTWPGPDGEAELRATAVSVAGERLELGVARVEVRPARDAATPARRDPPRPSGRGRRVLVCTHQLCLGGASRYLVETLAALRQREAIDPVVFSPLGGPSRALLEDLGIPVHVSGPLPLDDLDAYEGRIEELHAWAAPQDFEAAFVNTVSPLTAAGAEVAGRLGIPAIWAIHESFEPGVLWTGCEARVRKRVEEAMRGAALAVFQAEATARIYEPYLPGRCLTIPYGLDLVPIDAIREGFDREAARRRLGVPADTDLVLCVGEIGPRKAQAQLALAFDLVAPDHPRARLALAGAGDTPSSKALAAWAASSAAAGRIELIPTTPEIQQWYGVADLVACAARIESLPRAVPEAMAWELPVLATRVFGIPELIEDGANGWLCEAGDTAALAAALDRALSVPAEERGRIGRAGRERLERRHDMGAYAAALANLLERAAGGEGLSPAPRP